MSYSFLEITNLRVRCNKLPKVLPLQPYAPEIDIRRPLPIQRGIIQVHLKIYVTNGFGGGAELLKFYAPESLHSPLHATKVDSLGTTLI